MMRVLILTISLLSLIGMALPSFSEENADFLLTKRSGITWSPDDTKIAFASRPDYGKGREETWIWIADIKNQKVERIVRGENPDWSPNGKELLFNRGLQLYIRDLQTGEEKALLKENDSGGHPSWSPDGSRIAFSCGERSNGEIVIINRDGSNRTSVAYTGGGDGFPKWSPDGKKLVISSSDITPGNGIESNIRILVPGKIAKRLFVTELEGGSSNFPDWASSNDVIVFSSDRPDLYSNLCKSTFDSKKLDDIIKLLDNVGFAPALYGGASYVNITKESLSNIEKVALYRSIFNLSPLVYSGRYSSIEGTNRDVYSEPRISHNAKKVAAIVWDGITEAKGVCMISIDGLSVQKLIDDKKPEVTFAPDQELPILDAPLPGTFKGTVNIQCQASDNQKLDKVVYILDGNLLAVLKKAPFAYQLDVNALKSKDGKVQLARVVDNGDKRETTMANITVSTSTHVLIIQAFDNSGNMTAKRVTFSAETGEVFASSIPETGSKTLARTPLPFGFQSFSVEEAYYG